MRYFFYLTLFALVLLILFLSINPLLGGKLAYLFNPALLFLVYLAAFSDRVYLLFYSLLCGLLFDLYSPFFFGFYTLLFLAESGIIKISIYYFLRQHNIITYLILNFITIIIWRLSLAIASSSLQLDFYHLIYSIVYQSFVHLGVVLLVYKFYSPFKAKLNSNLIN